LNLLLDILDISLQSCVFAIKDLLDIGNVVVDGNGSGALRRGEIASSGDLIAAARPGEAHDVEVPLLSVLGLQVGRRWRQSAFQFCHLF
jgi:hypothetical protein